MIARLSVREQIDGTDTLVVLNTELETAAVASEQLHKMVSLAII